MVKKIVTFRIEPSVADRLRVLAQQYERPIGDILEGVLDFLESPKYVNDEQFKTRFAGLLDMSIMNSGGEGDFVNIPGEVPDTMVWDFIRAKQKEAREAKKRELEEELRKLKLEDE
jgi:hypothetical protein